MKILLIDDSGLSRNMFKRALGEEEHTYVEAVDGISGLEKYYIEKPDLVILDLTMPGINGMDVLTKLREMDPNARVVIGTADIQDESRRMAEEMGALAFITKPFTSESIRAEISRVLKEDEHGNDPEGEG
jgi:two-component system, chemotaxis family, chemotaxis protein CheY